MAPLSLAMLTKSPCMGTIIVGLQNSTSITNGLHPRDYIHVLYSLWKVFPPSDHLWSDEMRRTFRSPIVMSPQTIWNSHSDGDVKGNGLLVKTVKIQTSRTRKGD
ncbi:Hypothetical predicted protein [Xyrichtys novacula]|uniref:Uncharacterized protein n=1 Tax=Xyrichtys novacula TaxID=13765 RepID=A0AAV1HIT0_XYRNO|nr:Hypothetical predicted protein [Xyrichtys novacula]